MNSKKNKTIQVKKEVHQKVAIHCIKGDSKTNIGKFFSDAAIEKLELISKNNKK